MSVKHLKWGGCYLGIGGAALLALHISISPWGWALFLGSNLCWVAAALITKDAPLEWQHYIFTCTSVLGIYQWLL